MIGHKISQYQILPKLMLESLKRRGVSGSMGPLTISYLMGQLKIASMGASIDVDGSVNAQQEIMARKVLQDVGLLRMILGSYRAVMTKKGLMTLKLWEEGWLHALR